MQRALIMLGISVIVIGLAWPLISKLPIGRLPGDIVIDRPGLKVFFPLTTTLILGAVVSLVLWLLRR
jgi:hypothetical protein